MLSLFGRNCQNVRNTFASIFAVLLGFGFVSPALAINGGDVINKMSPAERTSYITGLLEGFGYARYRQDSPDETGMNCIINWYYEGGEPVKQTIRQWFERHADKPASVLIYALVKKECGE